MTQLLQNAAAGTAAILAAALLRHFLKNRLAPEVWLVLWAVCLFRLFTPAAPESALSVYALPQRLAQEMAEEQAASSSVLSGQGGTQGEGAAALSALVDPAHDGPGAPALDREAVLTAVWLAGSAVMALRYLLAWRSARRSVRRAPLVSPCDPRYAALPEGVRLREGPVDGAPLTFGAARPTVVLPPGLTGEALECVLAHEGVHARRRDNIWHYAAAAALTVFWWDPAVWLMARLLRRDVELSCDRAALRSLGVERQNDYARALLSMSAREEGPTFCQPFGEKQAKERILAVINYKKMTAYSVALALALVVGVTAAFASDPIKNVETGPEPWVPSQFTFAPDTFEYEPFNSTGLFQVDSGFFVFGMRNQRDEPALFTFITDENGAYRAQETNMAAITAHMEQLVAGGGMTRQESAEMLARFERLLDPAVKNCARVYFIGEIIYQN